MDPLENALQTETSQFCSTYEWLKDSMPSCFFTANSSQEILFITHGLMQLSRQDYCSHLKVENGVFILSLDEPHLGSKCLQSYSDQTLISYTLFVSNVAFVNEKALRITKITFSSQQKTPFLSNLSSEEQEQLLKTLQENNGALSSLDKLPKNISSSIVEALPLDQKISLLLCVLEALKSDHCCYKVFCDTKLHIVLAWKELLLPNFVYRLSLLLEKRGLQLTSLQMDRIEGIVLVAFSCEGLHHKAPWQETDIDALVEEMTSFPYFEGLDGIEKTFANSGLLSEGAVNILKAITYLIHQTLLHCDIYAYSLEHIEEDLQRYPNIVVDLMQLFSHKFHPEKNSLELYKTSYTKIAEEIRAIDTGDSFYDPRRKKVLNQFLFSIDCMLKTNAYHYSKRAICFRLRPEYLGGTACDISHKFPELPYAIFFMKGFHFLGFHIRFADLARGGLRTVAIQDKEKAFSERNHVLLECYTLAYTQNKKNKDIPEGGAKGVIFLEPLEESLDHKKALLQYAQKAYVESLLSLVNCHTDGTLRATHTVDYLQKPEYIYLGPDENMHSEMISWIAAYSKQKLYFPGIAFISSKPNIGINHKEFGVTSLGVNVYMEEALRFLKIDPTKQQFTIKMTGGPDGDVAGNQMLNLGKYYPKTAKLLTTVDISGLIFDPLGLDLQVLAELFHQGKPICHYPAHLLSHGGFITSFIDQGEGCCLRKKNTDLIEEKISAFHVQQQIRHTLYQTQADIFLPAGGRPRSLHEGNIEEFLISKEIPSVKAVIEGANLYLTPEARKALEKRGTLVLKDSSANKGGVICSSFEVLLGLCLSEEEFLAQKPQLVAEILEVVESKSRKEAHLLLSTYKIQGIPLTELSEKISLHIQTYKKQILHYLDTISLSLDPEDPLNQILLSYALKTLRSKYPSRIFSHIPEPHKKAIIACHLASELVYSKGLSWQPNVEDMIPSIIENFFR